MKSYKTGLVFGVSAYTSWGLLSLYWPLLAPTGSFEIVSHRAVWTVVFCLLALAYQKQLKTTLVLLTNKKIFFRLLLASALVSINWLTYIWGVSNGHIVECALGYYINPLIIISFGVILLKERLRNLQWIAVGTAAIGVIVLTVDYGRPPWIALTLAISWGSYGLVKKQLGLGALQGLAIETIISFIPYLTYILILVHNGKSHFGSTPKLTILMILAGGATAIPLLLFNGSTNRLPFTVIGLLQYITPTVQFVIGIYVRHESMDTGRWLGFFIIWVALIALGTDLVKSGSPSNNGFAELD